MRNTFYALAVMYAGAFALVLFLPEQVIGVLNQAAMATGWGTPMADGTGPDGFWQVPASAMMATSGALFVLAARRPNERGYQWALLVSKIVPLLAFAARFAEHGHFAYLAGAAADLELTLLLLAFLLQRQAQAPMPSTWSQALGVLHSRRRPFTR
jgi:hypothetical protein